MTVIKVPSALLLVSAGTNLAFTFALVLKLAGISMPEAEEGKPLISTLTFLRHERLEASSIFSTP